MIPQKVSEERKWWLEHRDYLALFKERDQIIICGRYGLDDGTVHTLVKVGTPYHLSRERVRQIINNARTQIQDFVRLIDGLPEALRSDEHFVAHLMKLAHGMSISVFERFLPDTVREQIHMHDREHSLGYEYQWLSSQRGAPPHKTQTRSRSSISIRDPCVFYIEKIFGRQESSAPTTCVRYSRSLDLVTRR